MTAEYDVKTRNIDCYRQGAVLILTGVVLITHAGMKEPNYEVGIVTFNDRHPPGSSLNHIIKPDTLIERFRQPARH